MLGWWLVLACGTREIPDHLLPTPAEAPPLPQAPATLDEALALLLGQDPLARRPPALPAAWWTPVPDAAPLQAWAAVARPGVPPEALNALEREHAGTLAVGLARGQRLAEVEALALGLNNQDPAPHRQALLLLSPLVDAIGPVGGRRPWALLGDTPEDLLRYGEGWVLRGWLDGPAVPLAPVAAALERTAADRLAVRFEGRLILARAANAATPPADLAPLERLLDLVLERAAAERDREQEAHRARCDALAQELGLAQPTPDDPAGRLPDPLPTFAAQVREALLPQAGDARAVGGALLAHSAARWLDGRCPECPGLDRAASTRAADRWAPALAPWGRVLRLALLKLATDRLVVGLEHSRFGDGATLLADALLGLDAGPLELSWLERGAPAPGAWLSLSRALGRVDTTDAGEALRALHSAVAAEARAAQAPGLPEGWAARLRTLAEREERRAAP